MALKIKYIFSDIDGVLTDGKVCLDAHGAENKQICYRDLDSIAIGKKAGDTLNFGGLLGYGPVMELRKGSPAKFINRGGQIPAPLQALKN